MKKSFFVFIISLLFAGGGPVLKIDAHAFSVHDFFSRHPKKQWVGADSLQKDKLFADFIMRELCVIESKRRGFHHAPEVAVKIRNLSQQILVNESYEQFVAMPLISAPDLEVARKHAKTKLLAGHILVGHSGAYLGRPPQRTLEEALLLSQQIKNSFEGGEAFGVLAEKYSDDPSVEKNSGSLGWIQWGTTVHEFQLVAFALGVGTMSDPVLTDFGYHLILINDVGPSDYQDLDDEAYESLVVNITKNSVRDLLRPAALEYDSLKIKSLGVAFNMNAVQTIIKTYDRVKKENALSGTNRVNIVPVLESLDGLGVVCVFDGRGYGSRWFSRLLGRIPSSNRPSIGSKNELLSVFRTIILQDAALTDGLSSDVISSFTYRKRLGEVVSGLLYDAYLKHLVSSAPKPDSLDITNYYNENKASDYREPEKVFIREIRVSNRDAADSLLLLLDGGADFVLLAEKNSSINPSGGGAYGPFSKKQNRPFFAAASFLNMGEISPVIPSSGGGFSIIMLIERVSSSPLPLGVVYVQIEALLIKKNQETAKTAGTEGLLKLYTINKNMSLLN